MDKVVKAFTDEVTSLNSNREFVWDLTAEEENVMIHNTEVELAREEGISSGAMQNKIEIAEEMLKNDVSIDDICKYTKLSKDEIMKLIEK